MPRDLPLQSLFASFPDPIALHERISTLSGQTFGEPYLDHLRALPNSQRVLNSSLPARAMNAFKATGASSELGITEEIQGAYYRDGLDLSNISTYERLAAKLGVEFSSFERIFNDPATVAAVQSEYDWVKRVGVRGFPALLLEREGELVEISRGFADYGSVRRVLSQVLSEEHKEHGPLEANACRLDGSGCS